MGKKILKMVNDWHSKVEEVCQKYGTDGMNRNSWWYLHGRLEELSSDGYAYDKAIMLNLNELPEYTKQTLNWHEIRNNVSKEPEPQFFNDVHITGIIDVEVYDVNEPCVGFFWVSQERTCKNIDKDGNTLEYKVWDQRGLVCLKSDVEACEYAKKEYEKRSKYL